MESALSSLILFAVGLFAAVTLAFTYLETQDSLWTAEQTRQAEISEREHTGIDIIAAETQSAGAMIRVTVRNIGQTKLTDFDRWDLMVEYYADGATELDPHVYQIRWLPYTSATLDDQTWTVSGIYLDADTLTPEVFDPGILNPDEEMVIQAQVLPTVAMTTTNRITLSSLNGINDSAHFVR